MNFFFIIIVRNKLYSTKSKGFHLGVAKIIFSLHWPRISIFSQDDMWVIDLSKPQNNRIFQLNKISSIWTSVLISKLYRVVAWPNRSIITRDILKTLGQLREIKNKTLKIISRKRSMKKLCLMGEYAQWDNIHWNILRYREQNIFSIS